MYKRVLSQTSMSPAMHRIEACHTNVLVTISCIWLSLVAHVMNKAFLMCSSVGQGHISELCHTWRRRATHIMDGLCHVYIMYIFTCIHICIYTRIYIYIYIYTCICIYIYIYIYMYIYICMYTFIYLSIYWCKYIHVHPLNTTDSESLSNLSHKDLKTPFSLSHLSHDSNLSRLVPRRSEDPLVLVSLVPLRPPSHCPTCPTTPTCPH